MKNYFTKNILPIVLVLFLLTGCGEASTQDGQNMEDGGGGFRVESTVFVAWEDLENEGLEVSVYSSVCGDTLYLLVSKGVTEPDRQLYTFCMDTGKTDKVPFSLETPGMENAYIHSMTVTGKGELTLRLFGTLEGSDGDTFLCRTDLTGKPLDEETPIYENEEFPPESGRFWTGSGGFVLAAESGDFNITDILRYNLSDKTSDIMTTVEGFVRALCPDGQDGLYYIEDDYLWHLGLGEETAERLFSMGETGISLTLDNHLLTDGEGRLAVCCVGVGGAEIYLLTDREKTLAVNLEGNTEQPETMEYETIRMADLFMGSNIVGTARQWSAKSEKYRLLAETEKYNTAAWETLRIRTLADLTAGQGPELLVVSPTQMRNLAEKGALLDLSELVPEDIQEQLLPGVRELGTVDGIWVGLGWDPSMEVIFTPDMLWTGDRWTVSDFMELAEEGEELEWIIGYRDLDSWDDTSYNPDSDGMLNFLILRSMGDSTFLDLDNGVSRFDDEEFIRVLEFCKRYGQKMSQKSGEERETMLQEGHMLAMWSALYGGFYSYANLRVRLSGCHPVGHPAEMGSGSYIRSDNYLVVNADATNLEAVRDCIAFLYSYDSQMRISTARKDVAHDQIVYDKLQEQWVMKIRGSQMIPDKSPDGSSFKEEYLAFLESCEPEPYCPREIMIIVSEESSQFFHGDRSAQETAGVIQRRVQLYLDEQ